MCDGGVASAEWGGAWVCDGLVEARDPQHAETRRDAGQAAEPEPLHEVTQKGDRCGKVQYCRSSEGRHILKACVMQHERQKRAILARQ